MLRFVGTRKSVQTRFIYLYDLHWWTVTNGFELVLNSIRAYIVMRYHTKLTANGFDQFLIFLIVYNRKTISI